VRLTQLGRVSKRHVCVFLQTYLRPTSAQPLPPGAQELWKNRKPPTPLRLAELVPGADAAAGGAVGGVGAGRDASACEALGLTDAHRLWSVEENARVGTPCRPGRLAYHGNRSAQP